MGIKLSEYLPILYFGRVVIATIGLKVGVLIKCLRIFGKPCTLSIWPYFAPILSFWNSTCFPPENGKLRQV